MKVAAARGRDKMLRLKGNPYHPHFRCQYLYFCTSKASKMLRLKGNPYHPHFRCKYQVPVFVLLY
jgi:hypothetical protein